MWLFVPGVPSETSCRSAPESEGLSLASCSPSIDWENRAAVSLTWRGKPQQPQVWLRRWKQGGFIRRLSGLTCSPSTLDRGVALFISSLRAIPARTTASPESAPGQTESGFLRPKFAALPPSAGLMLSSARTCRGTPTGRSGPSSQHWKDWATALRQEYSRRPKPATPCGASDCSSWPSPMAGAAGTENYNAAGNSDFSRKAMELAEETLAQNWAAPRASSHHGPGEHGQGGQDLQTQVDQWEAPTVGAVTGGNRTRSGARSDELLLTGQAVETSQKWSSPKASDPEKAGPNMRGSKGDVPLPGQAAQWASPLAQNHKGSGTAIHRPDNGKLRDDMLHFQAEQLFLPPSSPAQATADGLTCLTDSPNSNRHSAKRKLNPIFVEALMRWPTGLSGFERQETAWTRWWQLQRSYLWALDWESSREIQGGLFDG